jgi:biopolymer transport protein ExbD
MTEILVTGNADRRKAGVQRMKRHNVKTDMTPMVDLGFLLITFFIITTELSKPSVVKLNMTKNGPPTELGESNALTILLDNQDRVYYYQGDWKNASVKNEIYSTNFSVTEGLGKIIREKQKWLDAKGTKEGRKGLMLLIKAGDGASYQNVIDALDEATINIVGKYAVLSADQEEKDWMEKYKQ